MNKAIKMVSLATVSTFSVAALAFTATAPVQVPVQVPAPVVAAPNAANQNIPSAQKAVDLETVAAAPLTCDPKTHYAAASAGTDIPPSDVQELEVAKYINTGVEKCDHAFNEMKMKPRKVAIRVSSCARRKDANSANFDVRKKIYGGCAIEAKAEVIGIAASTMNEDEEADKMVSVQETCGTFPGLANDNVKFKEVAGQ